MKARSIAGLAGGLVLIGCATLASEAGDTDAERPNAHAGPFRALRASELTTHDAPYVLKKQLANFHEASVLDLGDGTEPGDSALYVMGTLSSSPGVYRFAASDGRSFDPTPDPATPVLVASETWEGSAVDAPEVVRVGDEIILFYSADLGIGAARSTDGKSFTKLAGPVLGIPGGAAWEGGKPPRAPSVVRVAEGDYRMFYEANGRIGEAGSSDGKSFTRLAEAPVLEPAPAGGTEPAFDGESVGDPAAVTASTAEGRRITHVYYTDQATDDSTKIGMTTRFDTSDPLTRATAPTFTSSRGPHAPTLVQYRRFSLLFVTQRAGINDASNYPAVAAGVAPATLTIPAK